MASVGEIREIRSARGLGAETPVFVDERRRRPRGRRRVSVVSSGLAVAALAALDKLGRGVFLIDTDGTVAFANRAARAMVARADGLLLRRRRLEFEAVTAQRAFEQFLAQGLGTAATSLVLCTEDRSSGCPYRVLVSPLEHGAGYCVFVYEPNGGHKPIPLGVLCRLYGLTTAEANLANELFSGKTLAQAAQSRSISINTAKSTLRSIFGKCNVRSRAELTLLLSLGPRTF